MGNSRRDVSFDTQVEILQNAYQYWSSGQGSEEEARQSGAKNTAQMASWCRESLMNLDVDPEDEYNEDNLESD